MEALRRLLNVEKQKGAEMAAKGQQRQARDAHGRVIQKLYAPANAAGYRWESDRDARGIQRRKPSDPRRWGRR